MPACATSTSDKPALPCMLDIEASGFGSGSYPIEIGLAMPNGSTYCTLIRPHTDWTHWDYNAELVHGISRPLLQQHGRAVAEVARELNHYLSGGAVYCDNWAHDYAWLARLFDAADQRPAFKLRHLRELLNEESAARFDDTRHAVAQSLCLRRHRASSDALVLQLSIARLREEFESK